jgi:hypothetical protein
VLGDVHDEAAAQVGLGRADDAAGEALEAGAAGAAGEAVTRTTVPTDAYSPS